MVRERWSRSFFSRSLAWFVFYLGYFSFLLVPLWDIAKEIASLSCRTCSRSWRSTSNATNVLLDLGSATRLAFSSFVSRWFSPSSTFLHFFNLSLSFSSLQLPILSSLIYRPKWKCTVNLVCTEHLAPFLPNPLSRPLFPKLNQKPRPCRSLDPQEWEVPLWKQQRFILAAVAVSGFYCDYENPLNTISSFLFLLTLDRSKPREPELLQITFHADVPKIEMTRTEWEHILLFLHIPMSACRRLREQSEKGWRAIYFHIVFWHKRITGFFSSETNDFCSSCQRVPEKYMQHIHYSFQTLDSADKSFVSGSMRN